MVSIASFCHLLATHLYLEDAGMRCLTISFTVLKSKSGYRKPQKVNFVVQLLRGTKVRIHTSVQFYETMFNIAILKTGTYS